MGKSGNAQVSGRWADPAADHETAACRPSDLIDLRHIGAMKGITVDGNQVTIGAGTTHAEVAGSAELRSRLPGNL